jgi:hypothetical protein
LQNLDWTAPNATGQLHWMGRFLNHWLDHPKKWNELIRSTIQRRELVSKLLRRATTLSDTTRKCQIGQKVHRLHLVSKPACTSASDPDMS